MTDGWLAESKERRELKTKLDKVEAKLIRTKDRLDQEEERRKMVEDELIVVKRELWLHRKIAELNGVIERRKRRG